MSASGITDPRTANGIKGVSPCAENRIEAIRAWESASTKKGCGGQGKKAYRICPADSASFIRNIPEISAVVRGYPGDERVLMEVFIKMCAGVNT